MMMISKAKMKMTIITQRTMNQKIPLMIMRHYYKQIAIVITAYTFSADFEGQKVCHARRSSVEI